MPDAPRLLHRHSHHGYTNDPARALFAEPEAVSRDAQEHITAAAHRVERQAQIAEWTARRAEIERQVSWLYSQRLRRDVGAQLVQLRRQLDRIDKKIAAP